MDFRAMLQTELDRRRARNPRYSLRAFARQLGTHHSTLSRILNGGSRLTTRRLKTLGASLGLSGRQVAGACLHENMERLLEVSTRADFHTDARWIATQTGMPIDDVNVALHYLIYERRLTMTSASRWTRTPDR